MAEQRAVARQRTFLRGVLSFQNGNATEDGVVRNLSARGAQLELAHPQAPEAFDLLIPARDLRFHARTVWKTGGRIGVAFDAAVTASARPRLSPDDNRY